MKRDKTTSSIDGFVPRRSGATLGSYQQEKPKAQQKAAPAAQRRRELTSTGVANGRRETVGVARTEALLGRTDIDESLRDIDVTGVGGDPVEEPSRRQRRKDRKANRPKKSKTKRIIKWVLIGLAVLLVGLAGYVAYNLVANGTKVLQGSILDIVQTTPLQEDENGRSNFLIFGTAEDDEGGTHGGANLTDSIMVLSVDQDKKDAYMISLPRDLWVRYQDTCTVGNQGKINAAYFCASDDGNDEAAGAAALRAKAGEILGLDIQYFIHLNFTAVVDAVNAVGGVDVTIDTADSRGILDRNFDWKCNYTCYYVKYAQGEKAHLDGEHALALARARNAQGGYGLPGGNFDREKNQQMIIKALREKALSAGTLANPVSVTNLMNALGNNLRTNIQTKEVQTLVGLARDISSDSIVQLTLVDEDEPLVRTDNVNGQSIVRPVAGLMEYSEIIAYVQKNVNSSPVTREDPHITVLNGGRAAGMAQVEADKLTDQGFTVDVVDNAPDGTYPKVTIYQVNPEKKASAAKLAEVYGTTVKTTQPPVSVVGESDFVIILGPAE